MPQAIAERQLREDAAKDSDSRREDGSDTKLLLPSDVVESIPVARRLVRCEFQFRVAQAHTTLREIRAQLMLRSHMTNSKNKYGHGTAHMTRSNALLQNISTRITRLADKYRGIRVRLVKLSTALRKGVGSSKITEGWEQELKKLDNTDLRGLTHLDSHKIGPGQGHAKLTWIWNVVGEDGVVGSTNSGTYSADLFDSSLIGAFIHHP